MTHNTSRNTCHKFFICSFVCLLIFLIFGFRKINPLEKKIDWNGKKNSKIKVHVPKFMLKLYDEYRNNSRANFSTPDVVRSVIPKKSGSFLENLQDIIVDNHVLTFDLPSGNAEELSSAELKILTLLHEKKSILGIERVISINVYDEIKNKFVHLHDRHFYHFESTWISFNVTQAVTYALKNSIRNFKIVLKVKSLFSIYEIDTDEFQLSLMPKNNEDLEHDYPILILSYVNKKINKRFKRNVGNYLQQDNHKLWNERTQLRRMRMFKNSCKKKSLFVNFADIGYDSWIIEPGGYEANQCVGKCFYPLPDHLSPSKHAIIQALMHSITPPKVARPSCIPTALNSISLLYIDEEGVLTYRFAYEDMVVEECGCR